MKQVTNQYTQPLTLEDGTILAAAGTRGSIKQVESISDRDRRRYVDRELIVVADVELESSTAGNAAAPAAAPKPATKAREETK